MKTAAANQSAQAFHERRLREAVKRLVIELGYLEYCLEKGLQDANLCTAATGIDTAIDSLNDYIIG